MHLNQSIHNPHTLCVFKPLRAHSICVIVYSSTSKKGNKLILKLPLLNFLFFYWSDSSLSSASIFVFESRLLLIPSKSACGWRWGWEWLSRDMFHKMTRNRTKTKIRRRSTIMTGNTQGNVGWYKYLALPPFHQICPSQLFIQAVKLSVLKPGKASFVTAQCREGRNWFVINDSTCCPPPLKIFDSLLIWYFRYLD